MEWLYEHTGGIVSNIISLIHDAQEIAILERYEELDLRSLNAAYNDRMDFMQRFLNTPAGIRHPGMTQKIDKFEETAVEEYRDMEELVRTARDKGVDIIDYLRAHIRIEEVGCG